METSLPLLIYLALGYLIGSLPFAVIVSKLFGLADPRSFGSGNPGATNVLRTGNKAAAALTLLGDAAKGWLAMFVAAKLGAGETAVALTGLAAFLGHVFPVFLKFRGGKGVAVYIGIMLGLFWPGAVVFCLLWLATAFTTRYSSLSALVAAFITPMFLWWFGHLALAALFAVLTLLLFYAHRENIKRLQAGKESRIGEKA